MYLFAALKDAIFAGRRSSTGSESPRSYQPTRIRRSMSQSQFVQPSADVVMENTSAKTKRMDGDRMESTDQEPPKRRRTLGGGEREFGLSTRLSTDRAEAPATSRPRLPSPLPRRSLPGPIIGSRSGLLGSPVTVAASPRAFSRPVTPVQHPRFVELLRRDPAQERALENARSIVESLDRITAPAAGSMAGVSRKYNPPQPLRPMRFKSLSSTRPVSLHDMLSGAVSSVPPSPQPPAVQRSSPAPGPVASMIGSPRHGLLLPSGAIPTAGAASPKRSLIATQPSVPESPKRLLLSQPARAPSPLKRPPSPLKQPVPVPEAPKPVKGGFIWGDPTKVSDKDFIDDDGFAPNADDSGSDAGDALSDKEEKQPVKSIFGTPQPSIFGGKEVANIFGSASEPPAKKSSEPMASIFSQPSKPAEHASKPESGSIFGPAPTQTMSLFGAQKLETTTSAAPAPSQSGSIFGASKSETAQPTGLFAAPGADAAGSIFGASKKPDEKKQELGIFGASKKPEEKKDEQQPSIFGAKPTDTTTSIFGGASPAASAGTSLFGTTTASPANMFGSTNTTSQAEVGGLFGAAPSKPVESKPAEPVKKPEISQPSIFGASQPSQPSIFGAAQPSETKQSIFGSTAGTSEGNGGSIFGSTKPVEPTSLFASIPQEKKPEPLSLFGSTSVPATNETMTFGGTPIAPADSSKNLPSTFATAGIFGAPPAGPSAGTPKSTNMFVFGATPPASPHPPVAPAGSMFGTQPQAQPVVNPFAQAQAAAGVGSIFGGQDQQQPSSIFGQQPGTPSNSLFGAAAAPTPTGSSIFGSAQPASGSMFGASGESSGTFSFGGQPNVGTPTGGQNPFAASAGEFGGRKILKAARRT